MYDAKILAVRFSSNVLILNAPTFKKRFSHIMANLSEIGDPRFVQGYDCFVGCNIIASKSFYFNSYWAVAAYSFAILYGICDKPHAMVCLPVQCSSTACTAALSARRR